MLNHVTQGIGRTTTNNRLGSYQKDCFFLLILCEKS